MATKPQPIRNDEIIDYVAARLAEKASPFTIRNELELLLDGRVDIRELHYFVTEAKVLSELRENRGLTQCPE
jgi:hypothetical protein